MIDDGRILGGSDFRKSLANPGKQNEVTREDSPQIAEMRYETLYRLVDRLEHLVILLDNRLYPYSESQDVPANLQGGSTRLDIINNISDEKYFGKLQKLILRLECVEESLIKMYEDLVL